MFNLNDRIINEARKCLNFINAFKEKKEKYKEDIRLLDSSIDELHWTLEKLMTEVLKEKKWFVDDKAVELENYHKSQSLVKLFEMDVWYDNSIIMSSDGSLKDVAMRLEEDLRNKVEL